MNEPEKKDQNNNNNNKIILDLRTESGIIEASQAVAQLAVDQRLPVQQIVNAIRAIHTPLRLMEIKQRYLNYKAKYSSEPKPELITLFEETKS